MPLLPEKTDQSLATLLKEHKLITALQYNTAVWNNIKNHHGIIDCLLEDEVVTEHGIISHLAQRFNLQTITLNHKMLAKRPLKKELDNNFIKIHRIIPVSLDGNTLSVAVADHHALKEAACSKLLSGKAVITYFTTLSALNNAITLLLDPDNNLKDIPSSLASGEEVTDNHFNPQDIALLQTEEDKVKEKEQNKIPSEAELDALKTEEEKALERKEEEDRQEARALSNEDDFEVHEEDLEELLSELLKRSDTKVIDFVNQMIQHAIDKHASDIHIETYEEGGRVRFRYDGVLNVIPEYQSILSEHYSAVITRIKIMSSLDISERRLPQDGGATFTSKDGEKIDLRVSILPTEGRERIVLRIMNNKLLHMKITDFGIINEQFKLLEEAITAPQGLVLVTGPTGSGKSTLLYAILNTLNKEEVNILTVEDPVESHLEGIGQVHVQNKIDLTFARTLRTFLRQDPEIIMVGEIRDVETCDTALKAGLTGHLVLSTLHTNDAISTITRLTNMDIPRYLISGALSLIVAQRLVRINCEHCKEEEEIPYRSEHLKKMGLPDDTPFYYGKGCKKCNKTGVQGRDAVYEMLSMQPALREAILQEKTEHEMVEIVVKSGFRTMQDLGKDLMREGKISFKEYHRVLMIEGE